MLFRLSAILMLAFLLPSVGCKSVDWVKRTPAPPSATKPVQEFGSPARLGVMWKDSVLGGSGAKPTRGFGGRVYFYDDADKAVRADGELIVYGFEGESKTGNTSADHKYVFKRADFQKHHSETDIGASYSVWIPWEKMGGTRKEITLIPMFKTADNRLLKADPTIVVLPGSDPDEGKLQKTEITNRSYDYPGNTDRIRNSTHDGSRIELASGTSERDRSRTSTGESHTRNGFRTTTFSVPRGLGNKMATLPEQTQEPAKAPAFPEFTERFNEVKHQNQTKRTKVDPKLEFQSGPNVSRLKKSFSRNPEEKRPTLTTESPIFGVPDSFR